MMASLPLPAGLGGDSRTGVWGAEVLAIGFATAFGRVRKVRLSNLLPTEPGRSAGRGGACEMMVGVLIVATATAVTGLTTTTA